MDAVTLRQYETLSPFEIKNDLAKVAAKTARASQAAYLNAGIGPGILIFFPGHKSHPSQSVECPCADRVFWSGRKFQTGITEPVIVKGCECRLERRIE